MKLLLSSLFGVVFSLHLSKEIKCINALMILFSETTCEYRLNRNEQNTKRCPSAKVKCNQWPGTGKSRIETSATVCNEIAKSLSRVPEWLRLSEDNHS